VGVDQGCYESEGGCFSTYGFEYKPGPHFSSSSARFWGSHFFVLAGFDSAVRTPPPINHLFDDNFAYGLDST
jgi:hypothetical protein